MTMPLRVTTPSEWKAHRAVARQGNLLTLPSGLVVRVRYVSPLDVLMNDQVPDSLTPIVMALIDGKGQAEGTSIRDLLMAQDTLGRIMATSAIVEPRVVEGEPGEDEISIEDVDYDDRVFLLSLLGVAAAQLATFCEQQNRHMERLLSSEGDAPSAE